MNVILLMNAVTAGLLRACVKRRPVAWWVWPLVLSNHSLPTNRKPNPAWPAVGPLVFLCTPDCYHVTTNFVSGLPFYHPYSHFNAHLECAVAIGYPSVCHYVIHAQTVQLIEMSFAPSVKLC